MHNKRFVVNSFTIVVLLLTLSIATSAVALGANGGAPRVTTLSGAEQGDPDGSGFASVWLNHGQGTVCGRFPMPTLPLRRLLTFMLPLQV